MIIQKTFDEEEQNHRILPKIKCKICGREFEFITVTHLKTHGITMHEYRKQFPNALIVSEGWCKKHSDENNPMYGRTGDKCPMFGKRGEETGMYGKGYLIAGEKHGMYGKHHTKESNQKNRDAHLGKPHSEEHKQHMRDNSGMRGKGYLMAGEKHWNWQDGISSEPYCIKFNNEFKERVRNFFGRCCYVCGKNETDNGQRLSVHHVNYNKMVCCNDVKPLFVPLSKSCHAKSSGDREYWEEFFTVSLNYLTDGKCFLPKNIIHKDSLKNINEKA